MKRNIRVTINLTDDEASWMSANLDGIADNCDDSTMGDLCHRLAEQIFHALQRARAGDGGGDVAGDDNGGWGMSKSEAKELANA